MVRAVLVLLVLLFFPGPVSSRARLPVEIGVKTNGDVNRDGYFDLFDLIRLERMVSLNISATTNELDCADVDGDGQLSGYDLLVLKEALKNVGTGMDMFDGVKTSIEDDLAKSGDNVETYLDMARFYRKEGMLGRSKSVLESIIEALDTRHPLYRTITGTLDEIKGEEVEAVTQDEDYLNHELYQPSDDITGKVGLRRKVVQMKGRLSRLLRDKSFSAHYNSKRVKGRLGDVMDDMLRSVNRDRMVDPQSFTNLNSKVRRVLEDPENLVKPLDIEQKVRLRQIVSQSTTGMHEEAVKIRQEDLGRQQAVRQSLQAFVPPGSPAGEMLNRRDWRRDAASQRESMGMDRLIVTNPPVLEPDTISLVAPAYNLKWNVTNVLGVKIAALEISKANLKFTNPRGQSPDQVNTLYYTPSLGGVSGERRGSALELEGVGTYYYRVAALNAKGEFISRFSDATPLIVVYNNVDIIANKPELEPRDVNPAKPDYTLRWDVSNVEGARDVAVEISKPSASFDNPNGRNRDRSNTFFFNQSMGSVRGSFNSNINGLAGPGEYLFRVIGVSPYGDFVGRWSDPDTLIVYAGETVQEEIPQSEKTIIPESPQIKTNESDHSIFWDVSSFEGAEGVNLEIARTGTGKSQDVTDINSPGLDQIAHTESIINTKGSVKIKPDQLSGPGEYIVRIAAVDFDGNLISSWSEPSHLKISPAPETSSQQMEKGEISTATSSLTGAGAAGDTLAGRTNEGLAEPPPKGKNLVVFQKNTPLYENKSISSQDILTLKKGEYLIQVSTDGLWYYVFSTVHSKYGWVLSFNVQAVE